MNHLEKVAAAQYLTKQAWDRDAWYSWIPVVGDVGNAISNFSDGNIASGLGDLAMGGLNFIPGLGTAAGLALKGSARGARYAAKGINAANKVAPKLTKNLPSAGATQKAVQEGLQGAGTAMNKGFNKGIDFIEKIPGGKTIGMTGIMRKHPGKYLAGTTALNLGMKGLRSLGQGQEAPMQGGGFQMPNFNFGGGQGGGGGLMAGRKGQMEGYSTLSGV